MTLAAKSLLDNDVVVVRQRPKFIEVTNQYDLLDTAGTALGTVHEVGQSAARKAIRLFTNFDQYLTHRYEVKDASGAILLSLVRPAKIMKSKIEVSDAAGVLVGTIVQRNIIGSKRFGFEAPDGTDLGEIQGESWISWNFQIKDATGTPVGRVDKKFAGLLSEAFTTADTYVLTLEKALAGPTRVLAFAAAVAIDTALKQDDAN